MVQDTENAQSALGPEDRSSRVVSIITPAFNEEVNLGKLYESMVNALDGAGLTWEWVIVDDHSTDGTFRAAEELHRRDQRVRGVRLSRNSGSHLALLCGLFRARGDCAVILAADLQDPVDVVPDLVAKWHDGAQVVWAVREAREGESAATLGFSRLYYWLMRRFVGMKDIPASGADFLLVDRVVIEALRESGETNTSLFGLITWMGFRQERVSYVKQARLHGSSGWSVEKKLKLLADSVTAFTYLPIRLMSYFGFFVAAAGFVYAAVIVGLAVTGRMIPGWSSLMVVLLVIGGAQMLMMGILGEYLWRALDEARRRPRFLVEAETDDTSQTQ